MLKNILLFFFFTSFCLANNHNGFLSPIKDLKDYDYEKAILGKKLFFDPVLSVDNSCSCASCHDIYNGGADHTPTSSCINGLNTSMNAPTVLNAKYNFVQTYNGRAKDLQQQASGPIINPIEMRHSFDNLIDILNNSYYKTEFKRLYRDGITQKNITDAIAHFEMTLITPNSKFDKFLQGDQNALSAIEKEGFKLFKQKGCILCHHGVNFGGNSYQKFGIISQIASHSQGRYEITQKEEDRLFFKVPTMRNIALTAPYFHDGRTEKLEDAVKIVLRMQLGRAYSEDEVEKIVAFLKTLTGEVKIIQ